MTRCPDSTMQEKYLLGELSDEQCADIERHAESCRGCAKALASHHLALEIEEGARDLAASRKAIAESLARLREIEHTIPKTILDPPRSDP